MVKRLSNHHGFSLIEIIFVSALLATALFGYFLIMQNATLHSIQNDMNSIATELAREEIEVMLADNAYLGYSHLDADINYPEESLDGNFSGFTRKINIYEVNADDLETPEPGSGVKLLEVAIVWGQEEYQRVELTTIVSALYGF